jgi:hypothetical protein
VTGLAPQQASADILDIVTGRAKRDDVLARLKVVSSAISGLLNVHILACAMLSNDQRGVSASRSAGQGVHSNAKV